MPRLFLLTALTYAIILAALFFSQQLSTTITDDVHYNLTEAYADLQYITTQPHPYNSKFNDDVRAYILDRLKGIGAEIADDLVSTATWNGSFSKTTSTYFEGTNILVKIPGTEPGNNTTGILFSAHYDSVSTSYGAVDDGMGIVTLLQLVKYFTIHKPRQTVVFNINNGEEDGLNGAHAFLEHPWSKLVNIFLNLEGAAAGGRPLLFRATTGLWAFKNAPSPHANVLSGDVFNAGLVKSRTDFSIYENLGGLKGIDVAFYQGRSHYHTKLDRISHIVGQELALCNLMETTRAAGVALANSDGREDSKPAVYFDLFFSKMISFPQSSLFIFNLLLLVLTPTIFLIQRNYRHLINYKFPLSVLLTIIAEGLLVFVFQKTNPYAIYSSPALVVFSITTLAFLTLSALPSPTIKTTLLQTYVLLYLFLIFATVLLKKLTIGGFYFFSFWLTGVWVALLLDGVPTLLPFDRPLPPIPQQAESDREAEVAVDETTPLLRQPSHSRTQNQNEPRTVVLSIHWYRLFLPYLQLLITLPLPIIALLHLTYMLTSLTEGLADGGKPLGLYVVFGFISFLLALPATPFVPYSPYGKRLVGILWLISTLFLITTFPFNEQTPLKVYFQQTFDSDLGVGRTRIIGVPDYLPKLISYLPSSRGKDVECQRSEGLEGSGMFMGLSNCSWVSTELVPPPSGGWWDHVDVKRSQDSVSLAFQPKGDTRACAVSLNNAEVVSAYRVAPSTEWVNTQGSIKEVEVWSRTWGRVFQVDFLLNDTLTVDADAKLGGRITCRYSEASLVPAYQELVDYLPSWGVATGVKGGLVDVSRGWEAKS